MVDHACLCFLFLITLVICLKADLALLVQIYLITAIVLEKGFAWVARIAWLISTLLLGNEESWRSHNLNIFLLLLCRLMYRRSPHSLETMLIRRYINLFLFLFIELRHIKFDLIFFRNLVKRSDLVDQVGLLCLSRDRTTGSLHLSGVPW